MAWLALVATVLATAYSAKEQSRAGKQAAQATALGAQRQAQASEFEAEQLEVLAGQEQATAQRRADEERRRGRILQSRALALGAASGGGASDPTVVNIISDLAGESEYLAATRIYEGEEAARRARMGAAGARFTGETALETGTLTASNLQSAGRSAAVSTLFSGAGRAASMYGRYGTIRTSAPSSTPGLYPYN